MATLDDAARIALALPEVTEGEDDRGRRSWSVRGKGFAFERPFSKADIKRFGDAPRPSDPIVAVRVGDLNEKEAVLAAGTAGVFTIPHFNGYAAVLVELAMIAAADLREIIVDGWLAYAPSELTEQFTKGKSTR
jgi:hypothetical protein